MRFLSLYLNSTFGRKDELKSAAKQEIIPLGGVDYNSKLEIYSHSLNSFHH